VDSRRDRDIDPDMSPYAPPYWQMVMRGLASETIELLRRAALRAEEANKRNRRSGSPEALRFVGIPAREIRYFLPV